MPLEARVGDDRRSIGNAWDSAEMRKSMLSSLANIDAVVDTGLFRLVDSASFVFSMVFESPEDWDDFMESTGCGGADADPGVIATTLANPDGRIIVTEDDLAQVLVRCQVDNPFSFSKGGT
jgi:hypothetical protein